MVGVVLVVVVLVGAAAVAILPILDLLSAGDSANRGFAFIPKQNQKKKYLCYAPSCALVYIYNFSWMIDRGGVGGSIKKRIYGDGMGGQRRSLNEEK